MGAELYNLLGTRQPNTFVSEKSVLYCVLSVQINNNGEMKIKPMGFRREDEHLKQEKQKYQAAFFSGLWVLYCLAVIVPNKDNHTLMAVSGLVLGSLFMWVTGWLLLYFVVRSTPKKRTLVLAAGVLVALDLGAKALVNAFVPKEGGIPLLGNWLSIQYAPNYSNNVVLNLLGIVVDNNWFHAGTKLAGVLVVVIMGYYLFRGMEYNIGDSRFQWGMALLAAGAASSIIESAFRGYILDFVSFASIVAFDFKDLCIMYGAGLLAVVYYQWEQDEKAKKLKQSGGNEEPGGEEFTPEIKN